MTAPDDMLKLADECRAAFNNDDNARKNIALRRAHDALRASAERQSGEVVAWRWCFSTAEEGWSKWIMLDPSEVQAFRELQADGLAMGHVKLQPLYAEESETEDHA